MIRTMRVVYLSSAWARREELKDRAEFMEAMGYDVVARWLDHPEEEDKDSDRLAEFAKEDLEDIVVCDTFVGFTDGKDARGGRHVELGYAIGLGKRVIMIGPKENVFHYLRGIEWYKDFECFLEGATE